MVVRAFEISPGRAGRMGLDVGSSNVREHFPCRVDAIELELDHLCIVCTLTPEFWDDRHEIHDLRLSIWLEAKRMAGKLKGTPARMAMVPTGQGAFRLEMMAPEAANKDAVHEEAADYALTIQTAPARTQVFDPLPLAIPPGIAAVIAPVVAFDRRKRSVPHEPERRGIGKLKGDDSRVSTTSH